MKRYIIYTSIIITIVGISIFFFSGNEDEQEVSNFSLSPSKEIIASIEKSTPKQKKYDPKAFKILPFGAKRIFPKRKIPNNIITDLIEVEKTSDLEKLAKQIKASDEARPSDFLMPETIRWDISQYPTNNEEYHLFVSELSSYVLNNLSEAILHNDLETVKIASAQHMALRIYDLFDFTNQRDKEGKHVLVLAGFDEYAMAKQKKRKKRSPATNKESVFEVFSPTDEVHPDLLAILKKEQTDYFEPLPGDKEREMNFIEGDPLNNTYMVIDLIEFVMEKINENDVNFSSTEKFHKKNQKIIERIFNDAKKNPEKYGLKEVKNRTDIDFEIYLQEVSRDTAKFWALIGSAFSVTVGEFLTKFFTSVRLSFTLNAFAYIGFEIVCTATGLYRGIQQMYVMHRFNSYIRGAKFAADSEGTRFNYHLANQAFFPELIKHSHVFRKLVRDTWITGIAIGTGVRILASKELFVGPLALKIIEKAMMSNSVFLQKMGTTMLNLYAAKTIEGLFLQLFPRLVKLVASSKILTGILKTAAYFLGPIVKGISYPILTAIDLGVTYAVTYFGINIRLSPAIKILTKTYASPGTNIQIALSGLEDSPLDFKKATRKIFYPLCSYLASFDKIEDVPAEGFVKRQEGCKFIIKDLEGFTSDDDLEANFPELYKNLSVSPWEVTNKMRAEEEYNYNLLINEAYLYPATFRTFWLTGLLSIFPRNLVTGLYWKTKEAIVYGTNKISTFAKLTVGVFSPDITSPSLLMNVERLDYATNLLSTYIYEKENEGKKTPPNNRTYKGLMAYTKYHQRIISDIMTNYNKALKDREVQAKIDVSNESGKTFLEKAQGFISKTTDVVTGFGADAKDYIKEGIEKSEPVDPDSTSVPTINREIVEIMKHHPYLFD